MFFNAGGYFFIYYQLENHFKAIAFDGIHNLIPIDKIEKIKFKRNSLLDIEGRRISKLDENEIMCEGKMYDIYKEEIHHDTIILFCINDEKEDVIENAFAQFVNNKDDVNKLLSISNIIKILIKVGIQPDLADYKQFLSYNDLYSLYLLSLSNIYLDITPPPPKNIS